MTRTPLHRTTSKGLPRKQASAIVALAATAAILIGLAFLSPVALTVVLSNGIVAAVIVLSAGGLGLWLVHLMGPADCPIRWRFLAAAGLGLGAVSLLVLGLGLLGFLNRPLWIALLALFALAGIREVARLKATARRIATDDGERWVTWLWLGVVGFAILALLGGTMPPGTLWPEEGNGYDVLEYHLAVPREYLEAGQIRFLPHNIYSNFPFNVEMLYLLTMILHGDAVQAALTANLLNVYLDGLAVASIWLAGREFGRGSGVIAGLFAASCPLLTYLSGLAYVENGMLMFSSLAMAAVIRASRREREAPARREGEAPAEPRNRNAKWCLLAGLFCGLACGCKYTAVAAVLIPLAIAVMGLNSRSRPIRVGAIAAFAAAALATFGPWLVKNAVWTGNPAFPLARSLFGERQGIWNDDCAARWREGHLPAPEDRPLPRRIARLWNEVLGSAMFGPALLLAIAAGGVTTLARLRQQHKSLVRESRLPLTARSAVKGLAPTLTGIGSCWLMIAVGLAAWLGWTHLVGRFAVVLIAPAAVILGCSWRLLSGNGQLPGQPEAPARASLSRKKTRAPASRWSITRTLAVLVLLAVFTFNLRTTYALFARQPASFLALGAFGRVDFMTEGLWPGQQHVPKLNNLLTQGRKILMIGDARRFYLDRGADYCVVFNPNPFAEAAARLASAELLGWLRRQGYGYLYVDWAEMHRLRTTRYGFWPSINRELIDSLTAAGLRPIENFEIAARQTPYATLFEIPDSRR